MSKNDPKGVAKPFVSENAYRLWSLAFQAMIPLAVIVIGSQVQSSIAKANVSQQYTAMAMNILSEPPENVSDEVRVWATKVVESYAPVKMTDAFFDSLPVRVAVVPEFHIRVPSMPEFLMEPPKTYAEDAKITFGDVLEDYVVIRQRLLSLQGYLREMEELYGTTEKFQAEIDEAYQQKLQELDERREQIEFMKRLRDEVAVED